MLQNAKSNQLKPQSINCAASVKILPRRRGLNAIVFTLLLMFISACSGTPIAEDLNQNQANQIVALLSSQGISAFARKDSTGKPKYTVEIDRAFYTQAKTILVEKGLPGLDKPSFSELVEAHGLLPNSRQIEALRLDHAIASELEEALAAHASIDHAKVIIRSNFVDEAAQSGASIIIQRHIGKSLTVDDVYAIVSKVLPGIAKENILISISDESPLSVYSQTEGVVNVNGKVAQVPLVPFLFNWQVPESDYNAMVLVLIGCVLFLAIIGGLVGYWAGYYQYSKQYLDNGLPDLGMRSLRLDRPNRDLPEV